jgi:hypothetical protein
MTWPPKPRADGRKCKHCGLAITEGDNPAHCEGSYRGKASCGSESGLPYGYNANAEGDPCTPICAGYNQTIEGA